MDKSHSLLVIQCTAAIQNVGKIFYCVLHEK